MLVKLHKITKPETRNRIARLRGKVYHFRDLLKEDEPQLAVTSERTPMLMPPIGVGHDDKDNVLGRSDLPKSGEIINLYRKGNILYADFGRVPMQVIKLIKRGVYDKVSCELWPKPPGEGKARFRGDGWMLKRLALLGADVPGVYTLREIPDPDEGMGMVRGVEIFETGKHNDIEYDLDDLDDIVRNYWLNRPADQKVKELVSRYLSRDSKKPLSDGAATSTKFRSTTPVFVFRDMKQTFSVSESQGRDSMSPDDIRRALVAQGIFEEAEVNGMPDSAIQKLATLCGIQNSDAPPEQKKPPEQKPAPAQNADDEESKTPPPAQNNDNCSPGDQKPAMNNSRAQSALLGQMIDAKLDKALAPLISKFDDVTKTVKAQSKRTDAIVSGTLRSEAQNFCDKLRNGKKLTAGMNADGAVVDLYVELAGVQGEHHFNDAAGKKVKGTLLDKFKAIMERAPAYENWDEVHGGPIGEDKTSHNDTVLKKAYESFSDRFKSTTSFDQYKKGFDGAKKIYGADYTVEEYTA